MEILVLAFAALLAFANGANDNSKGVATLVGYGATTPKRALLWAAVTTATGALVGFFASGGLVHAFRAGFVGGGLDLSPRFFAAALAGAIVWVLVATRTGLPVSTTHAILGGLVGAGLLEVGAARVEWSVLATKAALPLLLSPLAALLLVLVAARPLAALLRRGEARCVCAIETLEPVGLTAAPAARSRLAVVHGEAAACAVHGPAVAVTGRGVADLTHWGTSGLVGFARGWNDTPKIAALALVALPSGTSTFGSFALVAVGMAVGGLLAGRRVLGTLSERITALPLGESLAASGIASLLVSLASWHGLPVSTTHVTTGGIVGAGVAKSATGVRWKVVRDIGLSWLLTLPVAAIVAVVVRWSID